MLKTVLLLSCCFLVSSCISFSVDGQLNVDISNITLTQLSQLKRQGANLGLDIEVDVVKAIRLAQENSNSLESYEGFTKGILETKYHRQAGLLKPSYGVLVFNMAQDYENKLKHVISFETKTHGSLTYGIWVFRCGEFINKGARGFRNWAYKHACYHKSQDGAGVNFENDNCPDSQWRDTNAC